MKYIVLIFLIVTGLILLLSAEATVAAVFSIYPPEIPIVLVGTEEYDAAVQELIGYDFGGLAFFVIFLILFSYLLGLYLKINRKKRSCSVINAESVKAPFILYLRSFADEKSTKKIVRRLTDPRSEEEMLIDALSDIAPIYAIGDPADKKMPYGATRIYVDDSEWRQTVEQLAIKAEIVVLRLGQTNNFWWEVEMALKKVPIDKIVFVIPWSKTFKNVSTLYKILLEHNIDITSIDVTIDKKRTGSISSVLYFKNGKPETNEIVIPRFTGHFLSYDNLLRNALAPFLERYGFDTQKKIPVIKSRIVLTTLILSILIGCGGAFYGHLMELKNQRPYELVEGCVGYDDFSSAFGHEINGTNLSWALFGGERGIFLLSVVDYVRQFAIESQAFSRMSDSEKEHVTDQPFNILLMIKKYVPEDYKEYVDIYARATLEWIEHPQEANDALIYYNNYIENLQQ